MISRIKCWWHRKHIEDIDEAMKIGRTMPPCIANSQENLLQTEWLESKRKELLARIEELSPK